MKTLKDMPEHNRPCESMRERGASALTEMKAEIEAKLAEVWGDNTAKGEFNA